MSRRESRREARRDVGGDGGRRGDNGSCGVDWQEQCEGSVHQLQQATGRRAVIEQAGRARRQAWRIRGTNQPYHPSMQGGVPTAERMVTGKSANQQRSANKQSASRAGSARRTGCIVERIAPRSAPGSYGSVGDRGPSSTRIEQRWASVSKRKIWTNPLVLPARLCGDAAGNSAHCYIGKVCCYCSSELIISGSVPGAAQGARGIAQAVTCL